MLFEFEKSVSDEKIKQLMKKIFVLLFSMWIPIYLVIGLVAASENNSDEINSPAQSADNPRSEYQIIQTQVSGNYYQSTSDAYLFE